MKRKLSQLLMFVILSGGALISGACAAEESAADTSPSPEQVIQQPADMQTIPADTAFDGKNAASTEAADSTAGAPPSATTAKTDAVAERKNLLEQNVTLDFKDADIRSVLRIIAFKSGINLVSTPEVIGNVSIRLTEVPWEKALNTIVTTYGFGYEWLNDRVIMVSTLEKLSQQRQSQEDAALKEPLDTQAFVLNFTEANNIKSSLEKLISERGKMAIETRSNTLIVTDTKSKLMKIADLIRRLDTITPQVVIEAKIIETTLGNADKLGIDWSIQVALSGSKRPTTFPFSSDPYIGDGNKMFPTSQMPSSLERVETTTYNDAGVPIGTSTSEQIFHTMARSFPGASEGLFSFGTLSFEQFRMVLEVLNQRTDTKVLSNPRITTLNNQQAKILVGSVVPIPNYEFSKETGNRIISGYTEQNIGVGLTVTPHVNEQEFITLAVNPTIDEITGFTGPNNERPIVSTRKAETNVMIKNGQTLVIGGLISEKKIQYVKKVPFLGDIPLLGKYLFSKKENTTDRTELLIFITPHIIDSAAMLGDPIVSSQSTPRPPKTK